MFNLWRVIRLSVPLGALTALGVALPAQAADPTANCTLTGTAAMSPPVPLVGGTGSYSFDNQYFGATQLAFNCHLVDASGRMDVEELTVTSTGTYSNVVCGTGSMDGTFVPWAATSLGVPGTTALTGTWSGRDLRYHVQFAAGHGFITFPAGGEGVVEMSTSSLSGGNCAAAITLTGEAVIGGVPIPPPPPPPDNLLAPEAGPPPGYPSSTCYEQGGAGTAIADPSELGGAVRAGLYRWDVSSTKTDVCVRVHGGGVASAGGLLEVDTTGAGGGAPVPEVADSDTVPTSCPNNVHHTNSPVVTDVSYGTNPASVCVTAGTTVKRITLKSTGGPTVPQVCWTPDPSGTRTCNR